MSVNGAKPKFAMYWAASCGGCEIAVLNIHEKILDVDANFEVVFWPVAMDAKYKDVEAMEDGSILLTLFNGGIRNDEHERIAKLLRRKSKILVAFGSCANEGCIPGLANLSESGEIVQTAFNTITTDNPYGIYPRTCLEMPEGEIHIPEILPTLRTLDQVVDVDYSMPGCPPESHQIAAVIDLVVQALQGKAELPPKGSVLGAGNSTVCDECQRLRNVKTITSFQRIWGMAPDPSLCLLEQGIPCNGPATRSGCDARCPAAGAQCIGCYGPAEGVSDYGARLISAFASVIEAKDPAEIDRILDGLVDPVGQVYRFNLAGSLLKAAVPAWRKQPARPLPPDGSLRQDARRPRPEKRELAARAFRRFAMNPDRPAKTLMEGRNAQLEKAIIEEYLRSRGLTLETLESLPKRTRKKVMTEASRYASLKLTELEARARFVDEVHAASKERTKA